MEAYIGLLIIGGFALLILWRERLLAGRRTLLLSIALVLAAMAVRALLMDYETLDYQDFLTVWVRRLKEQGGFRALCYNIGNYNVPYLYFLAAFTYLKIRDLYLIKLLSCLFDVLLAWGTLRLVSCFTDSKGKRLGSFFVILFLPTVVLNGACWGQCDSIYVAFAVWSICFALENHPVASMVSIALSFAFKLQAVFVMPVFLILMFAKKICWYHLPIFPATYFIAVLPAILAGRSVKSTLLLYFNQADTAGSALNYNSSSVFALLRTRNPENPELLARLGIIAAFALLVILFFYCWLYRRRLSDRALLLCTVLIVVAVPYLLPHMHDRYFFAADALSVALAFVIPELLPLPFCVSFASLLGYHAYLKMRYLLPMRYGALALLAVLLILIVALGYETMRHSPAKARRNK